MGGLADFLEVLSGQPRSPSGAAPDPGMPNRDGSLLVPEGMRQDAVMPPGVPETFRSPEDGLLGTIGGFHRHREEEFARRQQYVAQDNANRAADQDFFLRKQQMESNEFQIEQARYEARKQRALTEEGGDILRKLHEIKDNPEFLRNIKSGVRDAIVDEAGDSEFFLDHMELADPLQEGLIADILSSYRQEQGEIDIKMQSLEASSVLGNHSEAAGGPSRRLQKEGLEQRRVELQERIEALIAQEKVQHGFIHTEGADLVDGELQLKNRYYSTNPVTGEVELRAEDDRHDPDLDPQGRRRRPQGVEANYQLKITDGKHPHTNEPGKVFHRFNPNNGQLELVHFINARDYAAKTDKTKINIDGIEYEILQEVQRKADGTIELGDVARQTRVPGGEGEYSLFSGNTLPPGNPQNVPSVSHPEQALINDKALQENILRGFRRKLETGKAIPVIKTGSGDSRTIDFQSFLDQADVTDNIRDWTQRFLVSNTGDHVELFKNFVHQFFTGGRNVAQDIYNLSPSLAYVKGLQDEILNESETWTGAFLDERGVNDPIHREQAFNHQSKKYHHVFDTRTRMPPEWGDHFIDRISKGLEHRNTNPFLFNKENQTNTAMNGLYHFATISGNSPVHMLSQMETIRADRGRKVAAMNNMGVREAYYKLQNLQAEGAVELELDSAFTKVSAHQEVSGGPIVQDAFFLPVAGPRSAGRRVRVDYLANASLIDLNHPDANPDQQIHVLWVAADARGKNGVVIDNEEFEFFINSIKLARKPHQDGSPRTAEEQAAIITMGMPYELKNMGIASRMYTEPPRLSSSGGAAPRGVLPRGLQGGNIPVDGGGGLQQYLQ